MTTCEKKDCVLFSTCETPKEENCYLTKDLMPNCQITGGSMVILTTSPEGTLTRVMCSTRRQVLLYLNTLSWYEGLLSVMFKKTGVFLTGSQKTLIKAARNGQLFEQGENK